jgi:hypothetical protein
MGVGDDGPGWARSAPFCANVPLQTDARSAAKPSGYLILKSEILLFVFERKLCKRKVY